MQQFLKHAKSGRIYPYNDDLARRTDMVVVDKGGNTISDDPKTAKPRKARNKPTTPDDLVASISDDFS